MLTDPDIELLRRRYEQQLPRFEEAALWAERRIREVLQRHSVFAMTSSRAKAWPAIERRIRRDLADPRWTREAQVASFDALVSDVAGCRVMVYRRIDVDRAVRALRRSLSLAAAPNADQPHDKPTGYCAHHLLVAIGHEARRSSLLGTIVEVQVATLAAHVFNELEHAAVYKEDEMACKESVADEAAVLLAIARTMDLRAEALRKPMAAARADVKRHVGTALDMVQALEHRLGRPVHGEFELAFQFASNLGARSGADWLADGESLLEAHRTGASGRLARRGPPPDDATAILLALLDGHEPEFRKFVHRGFADSPTAADLLARMDRSDEPAP